MVSSVAACCAWLSYGARPTMHCQLGRLSSFSFFCPCWPLTFKFGQDFCTMYLTTKFDRPMFSRSEVIVRTNEQIDWQTKLTPPKTSASLRYTMPWITSGQSNLTKRPHCHCQTQMVQAAPMCTPHNTFFLGPTRVHNPNGISICSAISAQLMAEYCRASLSISFPLKIAPWHAAIWTFI